MNKLIELFEKTKELLEENNDMIIPVDDAAYEVIEEVMDAEIAKAAKRWKPIFRDITNTIEESSREEMLENLRSLSEKMDSEEEKESSLAELLMLVVLGQMVKRKGKDIKLIESIMAFRRTDSSAKGERKQILRDYIGWMLEKAEADEGQKPAD